MRSGATAALADARLATLVTAAFAVIRDHAQALRPSATLSRLASRAASKASAFAFRAAA